MASDIECRCSYIKNSSLRAYQGRGMLGYITCFLILLTAPLSSCSSTGARVATADLEGYPGEGYSMEVLIGTPPQRLNVLVDTGSSNFAVACSHHKDIEKYFHPKRSTSYHSLGIDVSVPYTQGNWEGTLGKDLVSMATLHNISVETEIACITSSNDFFINGSNWQGIIGLAFAEIARPSSSVQPFLDALLVEDVFENTFAMQLCGITDSADNSSSPLHGTIMFGEPDYDSSDHHGNMSYATVPKDWFYEVVMTDISVDSESLDLDCKEYNFDKTIVDSGTTNIRLPEKPYFKLIAEIEKRVMLDDVMLSEAFWMGIDVFCMLDEESLDDAFPSITFYLASSNSTAVGLQVLPSQYIRPVDRQFDEELQVYLQCYKSALSTSDTGSVLGAVFMEGYYVEFDRQNHRIGFAASDCSASHPTITSDVFYKDTMDCAFVRPAPTPSALLITAYIMAGVCAASFLPVVVVLARWQWRNFRRRWRHRNDETLLESDQFQNCSP